MTTIELDALAAALTILEFAEAEEEARGLRHPMHVAHLDPIKKRVKRIMAAYFKRQRQAILEDIRLRFWHHEMPIREAADGGSGGKKGKKRASELLPESLSPLNFAATPAESSDYNGAILDAIKAAERQMAKEIESAGTIGPNKVTTYLEKNSLTKLTGDFSTTTTQRLRNAIADSVDAGGTADDIVSAIKVVMKDFTTTRANLIAQTEVNAAYNFGRHEMADAAGFTEKSWVTESGNPCDVCDDNEYQEWIDITESFQSGNAIPPAHPNCQCSCNYRLDTANEGGRESKESISSERAWRNETSRRIAIREE